MLGSSELCLTRFVLTLILKTTKLDFELVHGFVSRAQVSHELLVLVHEPSWDIFFAQFFHLLI